MSRISLFTTLSVVCLINGCFVPAWFDWGELDPELLEIPQGVAYVESSSDMFAQDPDDPLLKLSPGMVIDDLAGLSGCWGAYAGAELVAPIEADVEFYQFDFDEGRLYYQILQRGADDPRSALIEGGVYDYMTALMYPMDAADERVYSCEVTAPDRITVALLATRFSTDWPDQPDRGWYHTEDPVPYDLQITLDGDRFVFGEGASPGFSGPHRDNLVFFRFDCPDGGGAQARRTDGSDQSVAE